jgi:hypothetical protein
LHKIQQFADVGHPALPIICGIATASLFYRDMILLTAVVSHFPYTRLTYKISTFQE